MKLADTLVCDSQCVRWEVLGGVLNNLAELKRSVKNLTLSSPPPLQLYGGLVGAPVRRAGQRTKAFVFEIIPSPFPPCGPIIQLPFSLPACQQGMACVVAPEIKVARLCAWGH